MQGHFRSEKHVVSGKIQWNIVIAVRANSEQEESWSEKCRHKFQARQQIRLKTSLSTRI